MVKKELEQAVRDLNDKIENLGEDEVMEVGEIQDVLGRCLAFIDYCKFEFGEDITDPYHDLNREERE